MSEVSVIIVTHNSAAYLPNCLASVTTEQGNEFEVIVVDNASTDLTRTLVRDRFPSVLLLENKRNRGFAAGVNQALRQAKGRFILLLNPPGESWVGSGGVSVISGKDSTFVQDAPESVLLQRPANRVPR